MWQENGLDMDRKQASIDAICKQQEHVIADGSNAASNLADALERLAAKTSRDDPDVLECQRLLEELVVELDDAGDLEQQARARANVQEALPPSMVSELSENVVVSKDILQAAVQRRMELSRRLGIFYEELGTLNEDRKVLGDTSVSTAESDTPVSTVERLAEAFRVYDKTGSGTISEMEMVEVFRALNPKLSIQAIKTVFAAADIQTTGAVKYKDFLAWLYQER